MSRSLSTLLLAFFLLLPAAHPQSTVLTVAAAADLTDLEPDLASAFRKNEPNWRINFVTGASAVLMQQIENGAPYDAFLSADASFVEKLASNGKLLPASVMPYAVGRVAVLWRDGNAHPLKDLTQNWVRIVALPNPKLAPYGRAAQQSLTHAGLWTAVQPKIVYGENVRQTLQMFESGNADAVLTSGSLLSGKKPDAIPGLIPDDWHDPIIQKAGIVTGSLNKDAARQFLNLLRSPEGQAIFAHYGFAKP